MNNKLIKQGNYYLDENTGVMYIESNSTYIPMKDPYSGGKLIPNEDGTFHSPYTDQNFTFDEKRNAFIPQYIYYDETNIEPAHIEGDYLVGNNSGTRYLISEQGKILTPKEIEFIQKNRESQETAAWKIERDIKKIDKATNIEEYLSYIQELINTTNDSIACELLTMNNKCYFYISIGDKIQNEPQAKIFEINSELYEKFVYPIVLQILMKDNEEKTINDPIVEKNKQNTNLNDAYFLTPNRSTISIIGINKIYLNELFNLILESKNNSKSL